jgi:hypothetical protein
MATKSTYNGGNGAIGTNGRTPPAHVRATLSRRTPARPRESWPSFQAVHDAPGHNEAGGRQQKMRRPTGR